MKKKRSMPETKIKDIVSESIKSQEVAREVNKIIDWIIREEERLTQKTNHQAFLSLDFDYTDDVKRAAVDSVLRLLGTRLLTPAERADLNRPPSTGLQATNRPNLFIYYEHLRPEEKGLIQEKYMLFISKEMKLPSLILPEPKPPQVLEEEIKKEKEDKKVRGIFETINKVLLGDEES